MSNLLPDKVQQQIRGEYRARFILTGASLAIGAAVFTALALTPTFGVLFVTRPATLEQAHQVQQSKTDSSDIAKAQILMLQLTPISMASSSVSSAISDAISLKPSGVHIDTLAYTSGASAAITIGGIADSRADIDKYRSQLQANSKYTSVKLPVGDLVGGRAGRFTITLVGRF